jgi:hypothetical protein
LSRHALLLGIPHLRVIAGSLYDDILFSELIQADV